MSEENKELRKELKSNECCEGKEKLPVEELEHVTGGSFVGPTAVKPPGSSNSWV